MGPLGFEPRTDGLKVSGSSFKTAGKQQGKRRSQATSQPKEHTCANIATVRALTATICAGAVNPNASILASKRAPCLVRWSRARDRVGVHHRRFASHCALAVETFPPRESHRPSVRSSLVIRILRCDSKPVTSREFIRRARNYAHKTRQAFRFDAAHGKGSHGRLYVGSQFTAVQRGELAKGVLLTPTSAASRRCYQRGCARWPSGRAAACS